MHVNESGREHHPGGVQNFGGVRLAGADAEDPVAGHREIRPEPGAAGAVHDPRAADQQIGRAVRRGLRAARGGLRIRRFPPPATRAKFGWSTSSGASSGPFGLVCATHRGGYPVPAAAVRRRDSRLFAPPRP